MSSSFLGQNIEVKLHSGGIIRGKITNVDAATGSLSILRVEGGSTSLTRAEIADLMLPNEATFQPPAQHVTPFQDPAVISYTQVAKNAVQSPALSHAPVSHVPRAPAAMIATSSDTGSVERQGLPAKAAGKKGDGKQFDVGTSSRTHTEDETEYDLARNGKKSHTKNKKKNQRQDAALVAQKSNLDEDFDFDKALKGFDKRKIWQEIKTTDQTDPRLLLVSHNRVHGSGNESDKGRFNGRNGQEKLGLHEPVLSPSPTASHTSLPPLEEKLTLDSCKAEDELQRVRGNALQQGLENSKLKDEITRLTESVRVLEALGGVELRLDSEDVDGHKWSCTIYESLSAHAEARRSTPSPAKGALVFQLKTFACDASKLRYLGTVQNKSDAALVEKMPPTYKNEMGLKVESASIFVRRIKEVIQTK